MDTINAKDVDGKTALHKAARDNDAHRTKSLLSRGANVNAKDELNHTPLHLAAFTRGHIFSTISLLLHHGADVNARDNFGKTPLHYLVTLSDDIQTIRLYLNFKPDVNIKDNHGDSPLLKAVVHGREIEIVQLLLNFGADVNSFKTSDGTTPLHWSWSYNNLKCFKWLLKWGADVNARDFDGKTPLMHFLISASPDVSRKLLMFMLKYSDENAIDSLGRDVFNYPAFTNTHFAIMEHVAKLYVLNYINISNLDQYDDYFKTCADELMIAKQTRLENCWVTFFDLLVASRRKLKNYAGNEDLVSSFKNSDCTRKFPIYGAMIHNNVVKGVKRRRLFDKSSILLSIYLPIFNPNHLIVRDIFDSISGNDLLRFSS